MTERFRDIALAPAGEILKALRQRTISCGDLLDHLLARVARHNPSLNAVVAIDSEGARARARAADDALARGESWGPLHGLPLTVKDSLETVGLPTTSGAPKLRNHLAERNAVAVQRIVDAGAIVFGKTNLPLYADDVQTYNAVYGTTNNPWDLTRTPGGSSGGAAAALAAGLTPLEIGSDIGGSIRNPAHFCGVYGHKPTWGVIPTRGHIPPAPGTLTPADLMVVGPMARSAEDLALAFGLLAGPDAPLNSGWRLELPPPRRTHLRDYRIAVWLDDAACPVDDAVTEVLANAIDAIARSGAVISDRDRPISDLGESHALYLQLLYGVYGPVFSDDGFTALASQARTLSGADSYAARFARGATQTHADWLRADERRARLRQDWRDFFERYDVLLTPVMPVTAFPHDQTGTINDRSITFAGASRPYLDLLTWAGLVSVVHLPATVAPVGLSADGLPVGIQIVGPYLGDRTTLDFAARIANSVGTYVAPPGFDT
jgi:amidase